jgi:DNA topoisomerase IB
MSKNKSKGGMFMGKLHSEGGIPIKIKETGQAIEVEGDEPLISNEAISDNVVRKRQGTNVEILDQINKKVGAKGMKEKATEVHLGDAIVCRKSAYDKKKRTYIGTDKQIVSAINKSGGCREIEKGAKAIEPDGSVIQYKKGGSLKTRWDKKKASIEQLSKNIQRLRLNLTKSLKSKDEKEFLTALVISIMMKTGERVGNYTSAKNGHFGVSGFRKKHIKVEGSNVYLDYVGKSGVEQEKKFTDKVLSSYLKKAIKDSPSQYVFTTSDGFRIKADRVNRYLEDFDVTAKDIRGFSANNWIVKKLENLEIPDSENQRKRLFNKVGKSVAKKIGHGFATLKKHYLMPEIYDYYLRYGKILDTKEATMFASGGELIDESLNLRIENRLKDNEITIKDLIVIIGKEPDYPYEYVGNYKLQKCFLRPCYKLV